MENAPAISVIMPMYNVEKYIAETLDSLLAQTLQDFEVIIVNDCSTDSSCAVVGNYISKFGRRMKLFDNERNSGAGVTRNRGLLRATGKYIYFLDADDMITPTALEEMYIPAKNFDADVVYCERFFKVNDAGENSQLHIYRGSKLIDKPTLESDKVEDRFNFLIRRDIWGGPSNKLVRRNLLLENEIFFPNLTPCEDHIWTLGLLFFAKKFLRIPNSIHVQRMTRTSQTRGKRTPVQSAIMWLSAPVLVLKFLDDMLGKIDLFQRNIQYRYLVLRYLTVKLFRSTTKRSSKLQMYSIYEEIKNKFGDKLGEHSVLIAVLCALVINYQKDIVSNDNQIAGLNEQLTISRQRIVELEEQLKVKLGESSHDTYQSPPPQLNSATPAISVIIPMYNVEKYISETLDSILAQTFQDFEVIVVDDCSPDNSYATVESCLEKFNGRLTLAKLEQNSGAPGSPRNKGIELSRGEYVYFLDSDDTITPTALEEMYSLAKKFDADVVQCEKFYNVHQSIWNDAERRKSLKPTSYLTGERVLFPKPTLLDADLEKRLSLFWHRRLVWNVCFQLIRREFIMNNEIRFCDIFAEDMLFTLCEASCAKKYLVVPNVIYFYRRHASSTTRTGMDVQKLFHRNVKSLTLGMRYFDNFLNKNEFFLQRVDLKYVLFDIFVWQLTKSLLSIYEKVPKYEIDGFVRKEFAGDNVALMSYIFNMMNSFRYQLIQRQKELSAVKEQLKVMKGATP